MRFEGIWKLENYFEQLGASSPEASVIISVAFMLFAGFALTRLTRLAHLPDVTAYIVA